MFLEERERVTENRLVIKRVPMRRTASIDPETGEMAPIRAGSIEIEYNGKIYGAAAVAGPDELHPDFEEARWQLLARVAWHKMAYQLLVEAGGPNLDDPDWSEDQNWIEGEGE